MDLCFVVHKLECFSSNPGKEHFEGLLHLLRYIRYRKNLFWKYYAIIEDATQYDFLRRSIIKTDNQLMVFYDSIWKDCTDTVRVTEKYIVFKQGGPIDNFRHVPVPVVQSSSGSGYNEACTAGMDLSHFIMLKNELMINDPYMVP